MMNIFIFIHSRTENNCFYWNVAQQTYPKTSNFMILEGIAPLSKIKQCINDVSINIIIG